ncbi:MAG TPA: CheR family methyltransferase [Acidobacteriaceae bacterium]|jgi:chemotaxis protein methyltransferase CheR|nr:CheR family methyltransferase [Acidobacteriaceae bacterium]
MTAAPAEVEEFRDRIEAEMGLVFSDDRSEQVAHALTSRSAALRMSPRRYLDGLDGESSEWNHIAPLLTVPEGYFFRHADHLRAFVDLVVPECMAAHPHDRTLRILSIGCAGGEEPFTLSMTLLENKALPRDWTARIRACDLNPEALRHAERGVYTNWALRATPPSCRQRYFESTGNRHRIREEVRGNISFENGNALHLFQPEAAETIDVVFFRNVLIYFSSEAIRAAINGVAHLLAPGGYLFLGPAETLRGISEDFVLCHTHETFYYRRKSLIGSLVPYAPLSTPQLPARAALEFASGPGGQPVTIAAPPLGAAFATAWMEEIERSSERVRALDASRKPAKSAFARGVPEMHLPSTGAEPMQRLLLLFSAEQYSDVIASVHALPPSLQRDADIQLLLALALLNRLEIENAKAACQSLLDRDSLNSSAHYILALCREQAQDPEGAAEQDRIAIYLDPAFAMPHLHLALMARRQGDARAARRAFEHATLLLARESASRLLMFGGGFTREALCELCRRELRALRVA